MGPLLAAAAGLLAGLAHGLGPDHCAALAALLVGRSKPGDVVRLSLRFAAAHAAGLTALAVAASVGGLLVPASWEAAAERAGGAVVLGLGVLLATGVHHRLGLDGHAHAHEHSTDRGERTALFAGGALALGGVRALVLALLPLLTMHRAGLCALLFVAGFATGVALSMVAFGLGFRALRERAGRSAAANGRRLEQLVGALAIAVGVWQVIAGR